MKFLLAVILGTTLQQFVHAHDHDESYFSTPVYPYYPSEPSPSIQQKPTQNINKQANTDIDVQEVVTVNLENNNEKIELDSVIRQSEMSRLWEKKINSPVFNPQIPPKLPQNQDLAQYSQTNGAEEDRRQREERPISDGKPELPPTPQQLQKEVTFNGPNNQQEHRHWDMPQMQNVPTDQIRGYEQNTFQGGESASPPAPGWDGQPHWGQNKHKKNKRLFIVFFMTAWIFTIFGLCVGKCVRRCRKNRKERIRNILMRSRTSAQIYQEIQEAERRANELKNQYRNKKAEEERLAHELRRQEEANFQYEAEMRNVYYPLRHPQVFYAQQQYQVPRGTIPVGRPLNQTNNSSFASEYPQL